jgi:hypothetical protein
MASGDCAFAPFENDKQMPAMKMMPLERTNPSPFPRIERLQGNTLPDHYVHREGIPARPRASHIILEPSKLTQGADST